MEDPLAHLMLSVDGQRAAYLALHELAHELCDGKWVVTGGGGYALVEVVPRAWTHLLAIVGRHAARPDDRDAARRGAPTSPRSWVVRRRTDSPTAATPAYRDWSGGYDPETWLDRAIMATRTEVFPLHGLDPYP